MDEHIRRTFDKGADNYDSYTKKSYSLLKERRAWQNLYAEVLKGNGKDVLNVGCGPGTEAMALADMGYSVTALDFSEIMIRKTRENAAANGLTVATVVGDAENLPFEDESFDYVVSNYAMWAIPNPERAVSEFYRVLRKGGILAFADCGNNPEKPSFFRKMWVKKAMKMRAKDNNSHANEGYTEEESEHLRKLWSKTAVRPEADVGFTRKAGFSEIRVIDRIDRKIFKGRRFIEYGYHKIHFMVVAEK